MSIREKKIHKIKSTHRDKKVALECYGNSEREVTHPAWENQEMLQRQGERAEKKKKISQR